jgi:2-methylcitrate dehydratase PrpD
VDALLDMKTAHGFEASEVASVDTLVGIANARNLSYEDPQDEMQARFSMHYCAALALTQERLSLADFTPEAVAGHARPGTPVARLLPLVTMHSHSPDEERAAAPARLPHRITVRLRDGRTIVEERRHAKGSLHHPFDDADKAEKFADCTRGLPPATAAALLHGLNHLDDRPDLNFLAPAFAAIV